MININNNLIPDKVLQASILDSALSINNVIFMIVLFIIVLLFFYNISPYIYKNFLIDNLDNLDIKYVSDFKLKENFFNKGLNNMIHNHIIK